jgi:two-component system chemotaxis sensor kinase CheA
MENQELREVFFAEAVEIKDALDRVLTTLERQPKQPLPLLAEAFRHLHTLKGNATAMGIAPLANLAHTLEDLLAVVQKQTSLLTPEVINEFLRANDKIGESLLAWREDRPLITRGIITKLQVLQREWQNASPDAQNVTGTEEQNPEKTPERHTWAEKTVGTDNWTDETPTEKENERTTLPVNNLIQVSETINVATRKLDYLLDLVGELSIENDRLANYFNSKDLGRLQRLTAELHHAVLHTRLVQVQDLWQKFHRLVRDTAQSEQKQVELILEGTETEIDRKILPVLAESMVHLIRNAISHGIESGEARLKNGKNVVGKLWLRASGYRDRVRIEVQDDGKGILPAHIREAVVRKGLMTAENAQKLTDEQALQTIFLTGFSSTKEISEISGRGIGLDVVKKSVEAIGGQVLISTEAGKGTTFILELPSSIALKPVLLFEAENITWAIPIDYVVDIVAYQRTDLQKLGENYWVKKGNTAFPILVPAQVLQHATAQQFLDNMPPKNALLIIRLREKGKEFGILADKLLQQKEIFEKPLAPPLNRLRLVSGASILGNGQIALTLDVRQWVDFFF